MDTLDHATLLKLFKFVKGSVPRKRGPKKGSKRSMAPAAAAPAGDPADNANRISEIEAELARMDGRVDKTKKITQDDGSSSSESDAAGASGSSDSDSE